MEPDNRAKPPCWVTSQLISHDKILYMEGIGVVVIYLSYMHVSFYRLYSSQLCFVLHVNTARMTDY